MIEDVILDTDWSKSDAFLLPLLGIKKDTGFEVNSYLFWKDHTIEDYKLVLAISYNSQDLFQEFLRTNLLPQLDRESLVLESYDLANRSIFVIDMSEWKMDIEAFLAGKYSLLSERAKKMIEKYHAPKSTKMPAHILCALYPTKVYEVLNKMNALEYVAKYWGLPLDELTKLGEIGAIYNKKAETLIVDIDDLCQLVSNEQEV